MEDAHGKSVGLPLSQWGMTLPPRGHSCVVPYNAQHDFTLVFFFAKKKSFCRPFTFFCFLYNTHTKSKRKLKKKG